ncbi:hypothetical protein [Daejeonella oryzae]|uniref:hypothetical protein n=1 Tax=Daejeonella oryzae TaxID=1122943 RepID=UPI00047C8C5C|nr:hypothetical protein [Daejeonella oryzae]
MTKEEIIKIIAIALIGSLSKSFFDNILGKYIPDKNILSSYIKKCLLFSLRYITPAYFLIELFISETIVDKGFIFQVVLLFSVLGFNVILDLFGNLLSILKSQSAIIEKIVQRNSR